MHLPGMHPQAGVVGPEGLPEMGHQPPEMGLLAALVLLPGTLGMTKMHPPGGMALLPPEGERPHPQQGAVQDGRQMRSRQCVCAGWVLSLCGACKSDMYHTNIFLNERDATCCLKD